MITSKAIRREILLKPEGEPFTPRMFYGLGSRAAIDQALYRLRKAGQIQRVARGVFVRPKRSRFVGTVLPDPVEVATAKSGRTVVVHGAEAARRLGLSTQVPAKPVFISDGASAHVRIGKLDVEVRRGKPSIVALADRPAGLAFSALLYLGRDHVTDEVVESVRDRIGEAEFEAMRASMPSMPAWLADQIVAVDRIREESW
jgi:hypothetical protein